MIHCIFHPQIYFTSLKAQGFLSSTIDCFSQVQRNNCLFSISVLCKMKGYFLAIACSALEMSLLLCRIFNQTHISEQALIEFPSIEDLSQAISRDFQYIFHEPIASCFFLKLFFFSSLFLLLFCHCFFISFCNPFFIYLYSLQYLISLLFISFIFKAK